MHSAASRGNSWLESAGPHEGSSSIVTAIELQLSLAGSLLEEDSDVESSQTSLCRICSHSSPCDDEAAVSPECSASNFATASTETPQHSIHCFCLFCVVLASCTISWNVVVSFTISGSVLSSLPYAI